MISTLRKRGAGSALVSTAGTAPAGPAIASRAASNRLGTAGPEPAAMR